MNTRLLMLLLFITTTSASAAESTISKPDTFSTYCQDVTPGKEYDGSSEYKCKFEGMDLEQAYKKYVSLANGDRVYFKNELPDGDIKFSTQDKNVSYHLTKSTLNILVDSENETFNYLFIEHSSGVTLKINDDTQY